MAAKACFHHTHTPVVSTPHAWRVGSFDRPCEWTTLADPLSGQIPFTSSNQEIILQPMVKGWWFNGLEFLANPQVTNIKEQYEQLTNGGLLKAYCFVSVMSILFMKHENTLWVKATRKTGDTHGYQWMGGGVPCMHHMLLMSIIWLALGFSPLKRKDQVFPHLGHMEVSQKWVLQIELPRGEEKKGGVPSYLGGCFHFHSQFCGCWVKVPRIPATNPMPSNVAGVAPVTMCSMDSASPPQRITLDTMNLINSIST